MRTELPLARTDGLGIDATLEWVSGVGNRKGRESILSDETLNPSGNGRRMDRIEKVQNRESEVCAIRYEKINDRLTAGAQTMTRHEVEINVLKEDVQGMSKKVERIESAANRVLAGIVVACVLLVINIALGR